MGQETPTEGNSSSRVRDQEALATLGQRALESDDIDALMVDVNEAVADTLDTECASVFELLPGGSEFFVRQGTGWEEGVVGNTTVPTGHSQSGYTLVSKEPVIVDDLRTEDRFPGDDLLVDHGVVSGITVPIGPVENPWGVLGTFATDQRTFTEADANFVQSVANVLVSAIETERAESELQEIYGRISDAFFALDDEWRFTYLNERAHEVINPEGRELVGENIWEAFPEATERQFKPKYEQAVQDQETVTFEEYYPEPLDAWFEVRAYPSESGLSVYFRDTTDNVERQRELRVQGKALQEATELIADPDRSFREKVDDLLDVVRSALGTDYGTLSRVDDAANEYLFEAVVGPDDADVEAGDSVPLDSTNCEHAVRTNRTLVLADVDEDAPELADRAGNAEWGISCYLGTPITVGDEVYGTFCFYDMESRSEEFSDWQVAFVELLGHWVSYELEREQYHRKLEASNERLEQFAYAASHDLQEPLRMVSSYLQLIERRYADELDDDGREFIEFAVDGANRMREMTEGLLEYSRVETRGDPFEPVDLDAVLADVLDDLQVRIEETDAEIAHEPLPTVEGDAGQLRQVFQNLVDNAIDYSGEEPPEIEITAERADDEWVVSVRDEGLGIDPEDQERIFEVFQSAQSHDVSGTGIGLALVERIVERHGGDIRVDSAPGEGTTFSLTLPVAKEGDDE
jgi:signal transduction histidine kinase/PAS domain-containing protein